MIDEASPVPSHLYKYRAVDAPDYRIMRQILVKSVLWWGSPATFNDPFDCLPSIDTGGTIDEKIAWSARSAQRHGIGTNRKERRAFITRTAHKTLKKGLGSNLANDGGQQAWRDAVAKMGVFCLAARCDNMLMWGHYAASHTGVCLQFDTRFLPFCLANAVEYGDQRPVFRPLQRNRANLMEKVLLRKADYWSYEQEWRIFGPGKVGATPYSADALSCVILGSNITKADEAAVRQLLEERGGNVPVKRARLDRRNYRLEIVAAG